MKNITPEQILLTNRMIEAMPDKDIPLLDVVTAGTMFLANAITQAKDSSLDFDRAFQLVSNAVTDIIANNKKGASE